MQFNKLILVTFILLMSRCLFAAELQGEGVPDNAYLDGGNSDKAVVLCHGRGKYPTWDVVEPLRNGIHEALGYHTVSIQMPTGDVSWREYADFFPDAYNRIEATVKVLKQKGIKTIYLMGHSMGSRMATAYLANEENHGIAGFIGVGVRNRGGEPLDSAASLAEVDIPVVDIYGDGGDGKDADHADDRSDFVSATYKQIFIPDANHRFEGYESEMVKAVVDWLKTQ